MTSQIYFVLGISLDLSSGRRGPADLDVGAGLGFDKVDVDGAEDGGGAQIVELKMKQGAQIVDKVLILSSAGLVGDLGAKFKKQVPKGKKALIITEHTTMEELQNHSIWLIAYSSVSNPESRKNLWTRVVDALGSTKVALLMDEIGHVKNEDSNVFQNLVTAKLHIQYVLGVSATPVVWDGNGLIRILIFRVVSKQLPSSYRRVTNQLQTSYNSATDQ